MMQMGRAIAVVLAAILAFPAFAEDKGSPLEIEMSGAGSWGLQRGGSAGGPELALEYTVIEHWLEIEGGISPQFSKGQTELDSSLIFKKPFELSDRFEFLVGAGPVWVHKTAENSAAGEIITEIEYFPGGNHKAGFLIEPSYSYDFGKGHEQSFGITAGMRVGLE